MTPRIQRLMKTLDVLRTGKFPVSVEKASLVTESFKSTEGKPTVVRNALAIAHVLDNIPIFIEEDDLFVGNMAAKRGGVELTCLWAPWPKEELETLRAAGFQMSDEERDRILESNEYWAGRTMTRRMTSLYDDERLWPYAQLGMVLPPFRNKEEGWGPGGMGGNGYGVRHEISQVIGVFQFEKVLANGTNAILAEAREELTKIRLLSAGAVERKDLLDAVIITYEALNRFAARFAELASREAAAETDPARKAELLSFAEMAARVPAEGARTFREAVQSLWFLLLLVLPSGILSLGRIDQTLYPYYRADRDAGRITDEEVVEIFEWLRIKDMQMVAATPQTHRNKYGGMAKWHNCVIGGQNADGSDATNELSYLVLEAIRDCPVPHHTLTMRVHEGTPEPLMRKALELIQAGTGLPAFLSDESCIGFLQQHDVSIEDARNYAVAGCLAINVPGKSRSVAHPMFVAPLVLQFALNDGFDTRTGKQAGPKTGKFTDFKTWEEFRAAFDTQLAHFIGLQAEFNNITMRAFAETYPQPFESALMEGGLQADRDILNRTLPFENGNVLNPIGMINVADSLTAIRKLVFDDKVVTAGELLEALNSDWAGPRGQEIHQLALAAPKYGNDDDYADEQAVSIYRFWAERAAELGTTYGGKCIPGAISIGTAQWPGGAQVGATPDGRRAGECLADESMTPMREFDRSGLSAMLRSAAKIDQSAYQATSLDVKLHPSMMDSEEGLAAGSKMIRDYFRAGGKHLQINVIDNAVMRAAQADPEAYKELLVRVGGCSVYFTMLEPHVQEELIRRTQFTSFD
nr:pyruvate formate lyase family protein [Sphingomonas soli]